MNVIAPLKETFQSGGPLENRPLEEQRSKTATVRPQTGDPTLKTLFYSVKATKSLIRRLAGRGKILLSKNIADGGDLLGARP